MAKKQTKSKKVSQPKISPFQLGIIGFVSLFAIIGATYVFASQAAGGSGPKILNAGQQTTLKVDADRSGVISYGDTVNVKFTDIKYDRKISISKYNLYIEMGCVDSANNLLNFHMAAVTSRNITNGNTFYNITGDYLLADPGVSGFTDWSNGQAATCAPSLRIMENATPSWMAWYPFGADGVRGVNTVDNPFKFSVQAKQ